MPAPDIVCCNLPYDPTAARPHQYAAQRLLDAIRDFQAQRPDDIGSVLISIDILASTSVSTQRTCAFLRFANTAVHREAVIQLYGNVRINGYALRFELAKRPPQPLTSDTTWRLDRTAHLSTVNRRPTTPHAATGATNSTARARSVTPTRPTSSKLAPDLLPLYAKSSAATTTPRPGQTAIERQFAPIEWQGLKKKSDDMARDIVEQARQHEQEINRLKSQHATELAKTRLHHAAQQQDHANLVKRLRKERDTAVAAKQRLDNEYADVYQRLEQLRRAHDATIDALHPRSSP